MSTATSFRLQLKEYRSAVIIYYIIIVLIFSVFSGVSLLSIGDEQMNISGLEASSVWFIFVCGMNTFRANFLFHLQFSSTRKTLFKGWLSSAAAVCLGMTCLNLLLLLLMNFLFHTPVGSTIFAIEIENVPLRLLSGTVYYFCEYFLFISLGYLITIGFYRLNKTGKWIVSILMGGCGMYLLLFALERYESYVDAIVFFPLAHPWIVSGIYLVFTAVILSFCWLLIRKMPAKV